MAARTRLNKFPLTATPASWKVMARAWRTTLAHSAVLSHIKAEQDKAAPQPKVKPVSAKNGYKKTGRRPPGRPSKLEKHYAAKRAASEARAASQGCDILGLRPVRPRSRLGSGVTFLLCRRTDIS